MLACLLACLTHILAPRSGTVRTRLRRSLGLRSDGSLTTALTQKARSAAKRRRGAQGASTGPFRGAVPESKKQELTEEFRPSRDPDPAINKRGGSPRPAATRWLRLDFPFFLAARAFQLYGIWIPRPEVPEEVRDWTRNWERRSEATAVLHPVQ